MLVIKNTMNSNRESIRVGEKLFDSSSDTFHHISNMIRDIQPKKTKKIISKKGRSVGIKSFYDVKGNLPKYGSSIGNMLSSTKKNKLYELFRK